MLPLPPTCAHLTCEQAASNTSQYTWHHNPLHRTLSHALLANALPTTAPLQVHLQAPNALALRQAADAGHARIAAQPSSPRMHTQTATPVADTTCTHKRHTITARAYHGHSCASCLHLLSWAMACCHHPWQNKAARRCGPTDGRHMQALSPVACHFPPACPSTTTALRHAWLAARHQCRCCSKHAASRA